MQKVHCQSGKLNSNTKKKNKNLMILKFNLLCPSTNYLHWISSFLLHSLSQGYFHLLSQYLYISINEEYLALKGGPFWSHKINHNSNIVFALYLSNQTKGTNLNSYHLLWQDFSTFSQFLKWFFHHAILNKLNMKKEG